MAVFAENTFPVITRQDFVVIDARQGFVLQIYCKLFLSENLTHNAAERLS